jgi:hypothetical protein
VRFDWLHGVRELQLLHHRDLLDLALQDEEAVVVAAPRLEQVGSFWNRRRFRDLRAFFCRSRCFDGRFSALWIDFFAFDLPLI